MNQKNTKIVLITGAGKRLGEATALKLHSLGMDIIIHYNSSEKAVKKIVSKMNDVRKNSAISIKLNLRDFNYYKNSIKRIPHVFAANDITTSKRFKSKSRTKNYEWRMFSIYIKRLFCTHI